MSKQTKGKRKDQSTGMQESLRMYNSVVCYPRQFSSSCFLSVRLKVHHDMRCEALVLDEVITYTKQQMHLQSQLIVEFLPEPSTDGCIGVRSTYHEGRLVSQEELWLRTECGETKYIEYHSL